VRKKRRHKVAAGPNWGLIVAAAVGVAAVIISGIVVYKATRPRGEQAVGNPGEPDKSPPAQQPKSGFGLPLTNLPIEPALPPEPPVPAGWVRIAAEEVGLSAHWPDKPSGPAESQSDMGVGRALRVENRGYVCELPSGGGGYELDVMILPPGISLSEEEKGVFLRLSRHQIVKLAKGRITAERQTTLAGAPATEYEFVAEDRSAVCRFGFVRSGGKSLFVRAIAGGPRVGAADAQAFFNSIRPAGK
jgi:hypothetical protein